MSAERPYRVARNLDVKAPELALARGYERLEDACADMGDGVVFRDDGSIAVFHERHLGLIEHRGAAQMAALS